MSTTTTSTTTPLTTSTTSSDLGSTPLTAPPPSNCVGPTSSTAGTAASCAGCPNQSICASGAAAAPDPDIPLITRNLSEVEHKILVLSGKGGVGKSTLSALLGLALGGELEREWEGRREEDEGEDEEEGGEAEGVGILDLDITGPSLPRMLGTPTSTIHASSSGWSPVYISDNVSLMSIQFLLPSTDSAVIWRGAKKSGMVKRFLRDVEWGKLKYLVVDTPPGTSDEHLSINSLLKDRGVDGAVLVTTPQEVAVLDVRREADFCRKAGIKILGVVENMSGFVCPNCEGQSEIFRATTGGGEKLAEELGTTFLGRIPLDPRITVSCDYGESPFEVYPDSPAVERILEVVGKLRGIVEGKKV